MSDKLELLKQYSKSVNVANELSEEQLEKIGNRVLLGFREDLKSMEEWLSDVEKVEKLASLKSERKNQPLPNSANVLLPLITKACVEFHASVYPEILRDDKIVKARVIGKDYDGKKAEMAKRVTDFMNFQLLFENQEWESELDRLLFQLPLIGFVCKKTSYDPIRKINKSEICNYNELIMNCDIKSLEDASRITHIIHLKMNDLVESKNKEIDGVPVFCHMPVEELIKENEHDELDKAIDVLEQHCKLDLDEDGYAEPYIVTVVKQTGKVLRIAPRFTKNDIVVERKHVCYINAIQSFVDYHFLVNPKGKFQSVGFGLLLLHLNASCNSILNQLLDAGQLANMQGGYKDARLKMIASGNSLHHPGEWKDVKVMTGASLKDGMVPIAYKEPSVVLYQLLNLLIEVSRDLSSSAQINNGTQSSENAKTGATIAIQNAGKKTTNSINKRTYRSLSKEFRQLFLLNNLYLDPIEYREVLDDTLAVKQSDFDPTKINIMPVADPNLSSEVQRMMESQFIQGVMGFPGVDPIKAVKTLLMKSQIPGIMDILADENAPQPPNPEMLKLQAEMEGKAQELNIKGRDLEIKEKQQLIEAHKAESEIKLLEAQAIKCIADAEAAEAGTQLADYKLQVDALGKKMDAQLSLADMQHQKDLAKQQSEVPNAEAPNGSSGVATAPSEQAPLEPPA